MKKAFLVLILAGCTPGEDHLDLVDHEVRLRPRASERLPFTVFGDGLSALTIEVVSVSGEVDIVLYSHGQPVPGYGLEKRIAPFKLSGSVPAESYELAVDNRSLKAPAAVHVKVTRDYLK